MSPQKCVSPLISASTLRSPSVQCCLLWVCVSVPSVRMCQGCSIPPDAFQPIVSGGLSGTSAPVKTSPSMLSDVVALAMSGHLSLEMPLVPLCWIVLGRQVSGYTHVSLCVCLFYSISLSACDVPSTVQSLSAHLLFISSSYLLLNSD